MFGSILLVEKEDDNPKDHNNRTNDQRKGSSPQVSKQAKVFGVSFALVIDLTGNEVHYVSHKTFENCLNFFFLFTY